MSKLSIKTVGELKKLIDKLDDDTELVLSDNEELLDLNAEIVQIGTSKLLEFTEA